jgi:hypothetical protein
MRDGLPFTGIDRAFFHIRNCSIPVVVHAARWRYTILKGGNMSNMSSSLVIPDSLLAKEATDILREHSTELLINHSMRVYLFAAEQGRQKKLCFDPELLYVAAAFHDFGLLKKFSSPDQRFEVDGANAVRQFLIGHKVPEERAQLAWEVIALHTTPGVTQYMHPEVALLYSGVGLDLLGEGFDQFPSELRDEIVAKYPRKHFKERFIQEYFAGFAHKPGTTFGTVNAGICERLIPGYKSPNACDLLAASPLPDSE